MKKHRKKRYRNGIRVNSNRKRIISLAMVWVLCLMLLPTSAFAAEDSGAVIGTGGLCAHHTEHDDTCGYVEGSAESPCTHEHSEDCYTKVTSCTHEHTGECYPASDSSIPEDGTTSSEDESVADTMSSDDESGKDTTLPEAAEPSACSHVCSEESGCIKQELNCKHEHNEECGYAPAVEGQPCTYVCTLCGMTEITAWSFVDTQDVLDPDSGVLALSASADSPVPYEDIIALLPAEITATTEDGTETLSLDSWSCDDYPAEGAYTGSYAFHAVLPEGYVLAADAPALTVTMELDDEVMLMAAGTTHAPHPICGASCTDGKSHPNEYYNNWLASDVGTDAKSLILLVGGSSYSVDGETLKTSGNAWVLPAGVYYLKDDIHIDKPIKIYGNVTICLNGHDISVAKDIYAFEIDRENRGSKGGNLTLTDCKENRGEIKSYDTANLAYGGVSMISDNNCTFNMYGGTIKGAKSGVYVRSNCIFNMYGGVISDTAASGVVVTDSSATFNMYGGEISRNTDFGVDVEKYATFNMYGGVIKDITKHGHINFSGVYCKGSYFNMHGGVISGCNRGVHVTVNSDYTNRPAVPGEFTMDGGTIKENKIGVSLYAIFNKKKYEILTSPKYTMTGGEIINNTEIGVDMGAYTDSGTNSSYSSGGKLFVGGTAKIQNNGKNNYGNVYFHYGEIKLASTPFTEGAYIGITTSNSILPTEGKPLLIVENVSSQDEVADYFHSDMDGYVIKCANAGSSHTIHTLNLTVSPHTHSWKYANVDISTVSVTCISTTGTCDYQNNPATVKISTAQKEYDCTQITEAPKAVLTYSDNWPKDVAQVQESTIEYYKSIDGGITYTDLVHNNKDLKNPGKYVAQRHFNGKWLEAYFSVVDNRKTDPKYEPPTAKPGLTYNGTEQVLINPGSTNDGTMQYKLGGGRYHTTLPTATNAGDYTVYYKVVGDTTHNDTVEQSITVTIGKAPLTGTPTFTPVTEAGKTFGDVTPTVTRPAGWPDGAIGWKGEGGADLAPDTPIKQGASYEWFFNPTDSNNYQCSSGKLVLWADTSGGSSSNPDGGNSSNTSGGGSNTGGSSSDDGNASDIGNSNSGSSNANIPPTPVTVPVSGDEKTIQVDAVVSGTTATIKNIDLPKLDTVIEDTAKNGVVTIDFSVLKKVDTVKLPSNVVKQLAEAVNDPDNDAKGLEIVLTNGTSIKLDAKVLDEKNVQANGADITLSIKRITDRSLNIKQKLTVGNRPALNINVTLGGKPISNMNGRVTVSASYELKPGEHASGIIVSYVDANGNRQLCETSYDPIKKLVSWKTGPLSPSSIYMIGYDESRVKPGTGSYVTYTVQKGSTLSMIARKYGCTVAEILAANSGLIRNPNRIYVGWQLKIPQD